MSTSPQNNEWVDEDDSSKTPTAAGANDVNSLINRDQGRNYWASISADDNGMLGGIPLAPGFGNVSKIDLQGSRNFLAKLGIGSRAGNSSLRKAKLALEGGAGIGRITEGLLLNGVAERVDVVEPIAKFTDAGLKGKDGVRRIYNCGLEEWVPDLEDGERYDLVWTQWCVGHLTDDQLVGYLERCKSVLNPEGGVIVFKENTTANGADEYDDVDSSVTR